MSAYIVKYSTMNRVANYVAYKRKIDLFDKDEKITEAVNKLIKDLWTMNLRSLNERYRDEEGKYKKYIEEYKFEWERVPDEFCEDIKLLMRYFKSLCNYTYQCFEGEVPKSKLYNEIQKYESRIAKQIASSLPEWKQGEWE